MLNKMNGVHFTNKTYIASKSEHDTDFGICHFAGVVRYDSKGTQNKSHKKSNCRLNVRRELLSNVLRFFR